MWALALCCEKCENCVNTTATNSTHHAAEREPEQPEQTDGLVQHVHIEGAGDVYFTRHAHSLLISENFQSTYHFDQDGRFLSAFLEGTNYKRGLDNTFRMKRRAAPGATSPTRAVLSDSQARHLFHRVVSRVRHLYHRGRVLIPANLHPWIEQIAAWDFERLAAERESFRAIYKPLGILPPDQYHSVVVQATEGCTWNRCTFCTFYRDRPFRIKPPDEFREHAHQVRHFFGQAIRLRNSLFLSDANALAIPQRRLLELLRIVHEEFPIGAPRPGDDYALDGIYSFLDIFGAERKTHADFCELREASLRRIYIGLETGDNELFALLNKPGSPAACVEVVQTIKAAGIQVGVILLAGAGGERWAEQHMHNSLTCIERMGLDQGDIVYLSPLVVSGNDDYSRLMYASGSRPLSETEMHSQIRFFQAALKAKNPTSHARPRVTLYHIDEFLY